MIEAASLNMAAGGYPTKRPRGRPRIENPANRKGCIRGARQGTIDIFRKACEDNGKDPGKELEELLRDAIRKLAGDEIVKKILDEMKAEKLGLEARIAMWQARYDELLKNKDGPPDTSYWEAIDHIMDRYDDPRLRGEWDGQVEGIAKDLATKYKKHWMTIKQEIKKKFEERFNDRRHV